MVSYYNAKLRTSKQIISKRKHAPMHIDFKAFNWAASSDAFVFGMLHTKHT